MANRKTVLGWLDEEQALARNAEHAGIDGPDGTKSRGDDPAPAAEWSGPETRSRGDDSETFVRGEGHETAVRGED